MRDCFIVFPDGNLKCFQSSVMFYSIMTQPSHKTFPKWCLKPFIHLFPACTTWWANAFGKFITLWVNNFPYKVSKGVASYQYVETWQINVFTLLILLKNLQFLTMFPLYAAHLQTTDISQTLDYWFVKHSLPALPLGE